MRDAIFLSSESDKQKRLRKELSDALKEHSIATSEMNYSLFLRESDWSVEQARNAILKDSIFRTDCHMDELSSAALYDLLKQNLAILPGSYDREGRPVVYFHAARHFPGQNKFIEILKLVLYLIKKANNLCVSTHEIAVVEQLEGVARANQDTRLVKLIVEVQKSHFPGIVGNFYAVNCPWYYPTLIALVKPWLSKDLTKKLHAYTSTSQLEQRIERPMLTRDLGGPISDDVENWIDKLLKCEGLSRADIGSHRHSFGESVLAFYEDKPAEVLQKHSRKAGYLKKKGNWVQIFNTRYVILTDKILFYYKGEKDNVAEGAILLHGARIGTEDSSFQITTPDGKVGLFSAQSSKEARDWSQEVSNAISDLKGCFGCAPAVGNTSSTLHMV